ncbi:phospholipase A I-like protein [Tanacetum coccineum]
MVVPDVDSKPPEELRVYRIFKGNVDKRTSFLWLTFIAKVNRDEEKKMGTLVKEDFCCSIRDTTTRIRHGCYDKLEMTALHLLLDMQRDYPPGAYMESCRHHIWQAIRASFAALYYLDDYSDGLNRWQDGATVANNPTICTTRVERHNSYGLMQKNDTLVSIGCCTVPTKVLDSIKKFLPKKIKGKDKKTSNSKPVTCITIGLFLHAL